MADRKVDKETGVETTGHSWDGIEELNNPLPRWWLWCLYLTIIWGVGYVIAYPAWPMVTGATEGVLGWSTRANVARDIEEHKAENAPLVKALLEADMATLPENADLNRYAVARGGAVFRAQCSQCHGSGAAGATGYPNLLDNDWLWGGTMEQIAQTIDHGIRNDTDEDARWSQMPAFGDVLEDEEIAATVEYVISLSSPEHDAAGYQPKRQEVEKGPRCDIRSHHPVDEYETEPGSSSQFHTDLEPMRRGSPVFLFDRAVPIERTNPLG